MEKIIKKVKASIEKMPTLSPVVHKIIEVANDSTSSAQDITEVIQLDPVLTAKVIKMVNSAYFGLQQQIKSLKQAVVMLGINTVKNVALSSSFLGNVKLDKSAVLSGEDFWQHSLGVAVASKMIARRLGIEEENLEEYFIAGLIHDIGKVLINNFFKNEMAEIVELSAQKKAPIINIEKKVLKLTHEEIGIAIGKKWKFENQLLYATGKHHQPAYEGNSAIFSMVVCVADTFVKIMKIGFSGNHKIEPVPEDVWKALEIEEGDVFEALKTMNEEIEKAKLFLQ